MVAADLTKHIAWGNVTVYQVFGYNHQVSDRFIQFHAKQTPVAADVPAVKSVWVGAQSPIDWKFEGGISLSELCVAISSTGPNYTAVGAATGCDLTFVVETDFLVTSTFLTEGDLVSVTPELAIWTEATGPKKLLRLSLVNNNASTRYFWVSATDVATVSATNHLGPFKLLTNETRHISFGRGGVSPMAKTIAGLHNGCLVIVTATPAYGSAQLGDFDFYIRGNYEN